MGGKCAVPIIIIFNQWDHIAWYSLFTRILSCYSFSRIPVLKRVKKYSKKPSLACGIGIMGKSVFGFFRGVLKTAGISLYYAGGGQGDCTRIWVQTSPFRVYTSDTSVTEACGAKEVCSSTNYNYLHFFLKCCSWGKLCSSSNYDFKNYEAFSDNV